MGDQGPKEPRCLSVRTTIPYFGMAQIFQQWARQNPYFPEYGNKNVKFHS